MLRPSQPKVHLWIFTLTINEIVRLLINQSINQSLLSLRRWA